MLTFYINRAGKNLPKSRLKVLENAKKLLHEKIAETKSEQKKTVAKKATKNRQSAA